MNGKTTIDDDAVALLNFAIVGRRCQAGADRVEVAAEADGGITVDVIEQSLDRAAVRYDRDGDQHYDVVSAFIKVDPRLRCRRGTALWRMLVAGRIRGSWRGG